MGLVSSDAEGGEQRRARDRFEQERVPQILLASARALRTARHEDPHCLRRAAPSVGEDGAAVGAWAEVMVRDDRVEVVGDLRDCARGVRGRHDVELAEDARDASADEHVIIDEKNASAIVI